MRLVPAGREEAEQQLAAKEAASLETIQELGKCQPAFSSLCVSCISNIYSNFLLLIVHLVAFFNTLKLLPITRSASPFVIF